MASSPAFAAVPKVWAGAVSTANTNRDGTGTVVTIGSAGSSGSKINRVTMQATGDPADSVVTLFLHDGSAYFLFDEFDLGNPAAGSASVPAFRSARSYDDLVIPTGWSLRAAITVALTAGVINVVATVGDL